MANKKGKKRSLSESEAVEKKVEAVQVKAGAAEVNKSPKKKKADKQVAVQNGQAATAGKTEAAKKAPKAVKSEAPQKPAKKEKVEASAEKAAVPAAPKPKVGVTKEELAERIKAIEARGELTKSGRRKLGILRRKLLVLQGVKVGSTAKTEGTKKKQEEGAPGQKTKKVKADKTNKKPGNLLLVKKDKEEETEEGKEEESEEGTEESNEEADESQLDTSKSQEEKGQDEKKKRYVLFVGNLPYTATIDDIKKHFLTKVETVTHVRLPLKPGTNSPRGIAYVEFPNNTEYEKGLALHHTQLNGRRINVQYTTSDSKNAGKKKDVGGKNQKLHALRKAGKLAGSQNKKNQKPNRPKGKQNAGATKT